VKELIARLQKQYDGLTARMESALTAASAEGATAEAVTAANADFDAAEAERKKVKLGLDRAKQIERENTEAAAQAAAAAAVADATPARQPIVQPVHNPAPAIVTGDGVFRLPAGVRRHGPLKAFKGPDAESGRTGPGLWVAATQYNHGPSLERLAEYGIRPPCPPRPTTRLGLLRPGRPRHDVDRADREYGVIRRLADVEPMASETWKGPRWTNNMTAYWVSQGNAPTQSEPGWDLIELVAKDLAAYGKMTVQLNEDALIDLGDKWAMAAAIAFAYAEDNAAFNGDGTSAYGGIVGLFTKIVAAANSPSLYTATGHTTLGASPSPTTPRSSASSRTTRGRPVWLCHKEVWANSMLPLQMAAGGATPQRHPERRQAAVPRVRRRVRERRRRRERDDRGHRHPVRRPRPVDEVRRPPAADAARAAMINDDMIKQLMTLFAASRVDIVNHTIVDPKDSTKPRPGDRAEARVSAGRAVTPNPGGRCSARPRLRVPPDPRPDPETDHDPRDDKLSASRRRRRS
jgi:hypothetical protein